MRFAVITHTNVSLTSAGFRTDVAYFTTLAEATAYFETRVPSPYTEYELVTLLASKTPTEEG